MKKIVLPSTIRFALSLLIFLHLLVGQNYAQNKKLTYLRFEITSTSDWTILELNKFSEILTMRLFAVEGNYKDFNVYYDKIKLTQNVTNGNSKIRILVDYIIKVDSLNKWNFTLKRGAIGFTNFKILVKKDLLFEELFQVNHNLVLENDLSENKITREVIIKSDSLIEFIQPKSSLQKIPKALLAFYYLWYTKDNWKHIPLDDEPEVFYSSDDEKTMLKQIRLAKAYGLDGFITSWDGPNTYSDKNFQKFLALSQKNKFKSAIYYETLTSSGPRSEEEIYSHLKYAIETYGKHPAIFKVLGKPLIAIWASNEIPIQRWNKIINRLNVENLDAAFIAMSFDISILEVFDGVHQYGVILIEDLKKEYRIVSQIVKNYYMFGGKQKVWIATVQPGYDERKIPGRPGFYKERNRGKFYEQTFEAAINSNSDLIFLTSWNEWWENTHIEPGKKIKNTYLNLTRTFSSKWKKKK